MEKNFKRTKPVTYKILGNDYNLLYDTTKGHYIIIRGASVPTSLTSSSTVMFIRDIATARKNSPKRPKS